MDHSLGVMPMSMSLSGTNLYEAARLSGGSSIMENLQSQLKLREGEIAQLQVAGHRTSAQALMRINTRTLDRPHRRMLCTPVI